MARTKRHPGTLRQVGNTWQLVLWSPVEKKARTFTLGAVAASEAEELAIAKQRELKEEAQRLKLGLPGAMPFSTLLVRYRAERLPLLAPNTRKSYGASLDRFRDFFVAEHGDPNCRDIRGGHVKAFLNWRRLNTLQGGPTGARANDGTASNRTLAKDRAVLNALFSYASELEIVDLNPVQKVRPPKSDARQPVILSDDQYEALLDACGANDMLRLYVTALGETGGRCESEVLWLRWEDVDLEGGFLHIASGREGHRTKSGKSRYVPMTPRLREAMRSHFARYRFTATRSPWVFHHPTTRRRFTAGDRIRSMRRGFAAALRTAKLPEELHQHDLRHRRVTTWLAEGKPAHLVKEAMGHSTIRVTEGYTHLAKEHLRALVEETAVRQPARELGG